MPSMTSVNLLSLEKSSGVVQVIGMCIAILKCDFILCAIIRTHSVINMVNL